MAETGSASFDPSIAMRQVGDDPEVLREVMELFIQEAAKQEADVRLAVERRDPKSLERVAHSIKGACAIFGAAAAQDAAYRLEQLGRAGSFEGAADAMASLTTETARLTLDLKRYLNAGPA